jgi:hypothetical protein
MYESITVVVDRVCGDGAYRLHSINFIGRLVKTVEDSRTTMRLYEWENQSRLAYLVHVEEDRPGRPLRRTLYPFINTHLAESMPTKGYTAQEVSRAYPEFANGRFRGRARGRRARSSPTR